MERDSLHNQINNVRQRAVHRAIGNGIMDDGLLTIVANKAERDFTDEVGKKSEERFDKFANKIKFVKSVSDAPLLADLFLGIDKWMTFDESFKLPRLPVQVKSSRDGVNLFKYGDAERHIDPDPTFTRMKGLMLVINSGPSMTAKMFKRQLLSEAKRIKNVLNSEHIPSGYTNL
jgi:hypothetical protein